MQSLKKYTILVVDDDETLRNAIAFDFKRKGFTVLVSESGAKAFELVKANKIDLVISDIRMPGGDGLSLLEQIRAYNPGIPAVIFVTGFADTTEESCLAKGAKKVIAKPFDRKHLMTTVLEVLNISHDTAAQ
ncbi:MAG: response regulator [Bdellovibrionota bacterium]